MNRNYQILLLVLLLAFASCSFTSKVEEGDKDKSLMRLITYVLEEGHISPQDFDDEFSKKVFDDYISQLDPYKRYFYQSDIDEFSQFKEQIDDQIKAYDLSFFYLTYERLLQRFSESKRLYQEVLSSPFDYTLDETFSTKYEDLPFPKSVKEMKERWRKQLKFSTIDNYGSLISQQEAALKKGEGEEKTRVQIEEEARDITRKSMEELFDFIDDRRKEEWFSVYLNAITMTFDPHTNYLEPSNQDRFNQEISGNFEGIGARLQKKRDGVEIVEVISGGPAWRQNALEVGDQILKVRQEDETEPLSIVGMRLDDAIKFIKGPKGSKVILTLKRVDGTIEDATITRDVVEIEETYAKSSVVEKDGKTFGIINLPIFYVDFDNKKNRNAASDIKIEIERLKKQGIEGLVLDLRNNVGGSLPVVVDLAGLFIEDGPVVQVKASGNSKEVLRDKDKSIAWDGPLVILVNELSASASEILAAAMQDYKRAIIIGSKQTYGKGTVQTFFPLERMVRNNTEGDLGALKFTIQKFYRINGGSTQLEGVKSDVVVPDRYSYIDVGEKNYDNPLAYDQIDAVPYTVWGNYYDYDTTIKNSNERMANSAQLKLIDENAKWIKKMKDRETFSLNYKTYKATLEAGEEEAKKFNVIADYNTNLTFKSLPYEEALMKTDTLLKAKRDRWHTSLSKDVYVEEALHVLNDLKMTYQVKNKVATTLKN